MVALWGDISVGRVVVGEWCARRLDDLTGPDDWHDYLCSFTDHNTLSTCEAVIRHRYSDGAAVLTALVMQLAEGGWD